ncbi:dodecin family protein [Rothia sp. ARF10]|nr:dodecin family protein [Rothia sp. ARF10]
MANHVYAISELVGSSPDGLEAAIENAVSSASESVRNLDWFEVTEIRGHLADGGRVADWQVGIKLGFRVEK